MEASVSGRRPPAVLDMGAEIGDLGGKGACASDSAIMILTCPECATRYFVDDARIPAEGRTVRCASCGHRWTASPEADPEPEPAEEAAEAPADAEAPPIAVERPADELPKAFRQRAQTRAKEREAAAAGVIWAALAGAVVVLVAALILLRQDIAQIWPRTASAYAMLHLPVNLVGLTIEEQHAQPMLKDGHAALAVSGALRNVRTRAVAAPPLKVSLLAQGGRVVATQIANPGGALIPPGETRRFVVNLMDPPASATDVEIAFLVDARGRALQAPGAPSATPASPAAAPAASLQLRGPDAQAGQGQPAAAPPSASPMAAPAAASAFPPPAASPQSFTASANHG
jgi:predicted Zn finger-like uncharacterized protein